MILYVYYDVILVGSNSRSHSQSESPLLRDMLKAEDPTMPKSSTDLSALEMVEVWLEMYSLADRFMITDLGRACSNGLDIVFKSIPETWWRVKDFVENAEFDCKTLRVELVSAAVQKAKEWCDDRRFHEMLKSDGEFALELVRALAK